MRTPTIFSRIKKHREHKNTEEEAIESERAAQIISLKGKPIGEITEGLLTIYAHLPSPAVEYMTSLYIKYHKL